MSFSAVARAASRRGLTAARVMPVRMCSSAVAAEGPCLSTEKRNGIAIIRMDDPAAKVNTLTEKMMKEVDAVLADVEGDSSVRGVVLISGKKGNFIAGADINMLAACKSEGEAAKLASDGQRIMSRIEGMKKPVVAAIDGSCLGGGLEVALACHYRVASSSSKTKMGLPEVKLGLLPGAGGTQRLPQLVGVEAALKMITTGSNIVPVRAKRMGLVDEVADPFALEHAAVLAVERLAGKELGKLQSKRAKKSLKEQVMTSSLGRALVERMSKQAAEKQTSGNYPAVPLIIDCVLQSAATGGKAFDLEASSFGRLVMTPESAALRSLFFGSTALKRNPYGKPAKPAATAAVLGAGLMGAGIAQVSAQHAGMRVVLKDRGVADVARGEASIKKELDGRVKKRAMTTFQRDQLLSQVVGVAADGEEWKKHFARADLCVEAVFEDLDLKHRVVKEVEEFLPEHAVFATNTSALPIREIAKASRRPERVVGMHYFSPVPKMPLLEIIPHEGTCDEALSIAVDAGMRQGKTVIVVKDVEGFYVNRALGPYMAETVALVAGGADPKKLDKAMRKFGFPVGPITLCDEVGTDVAGHVASFLSGALGNRMAGAEHDVLTRMVKDGMLGRKSGAGFFEYSKGKRTGVNPKAETILSNVRTKVPQDAADLSADDLAMRAAGRFINEAAFCLQDEIVRNPTEADIGAVFGIGFPPFHGGPFRFLDSYGVGKFVDRMSSFAEKYGDHFEPAPILKDYAAGNKKFHAQ